MLENALSYREANPPSRAEDTTCVYVIHESKVAF